MNHFPSSHRFVRIHALALTAALVVGGVPRLAAYKVDKYGGIHAEPHDIQQANFERFQSDKANWERSQRRASGPVEESGFTKWARELRENEEAREAAAARKEQEKIDAKERAAREERNFRLQLKNAEEDARRAAASKELDRQIAADIFERNYGKITRSSQACLTAFRAGTPMPKEGSEQVAQAMLSGTFGLTDLAKIGLNYPESERYALALEIYRQRNKPYASHSWPAVTAHVALGQLGNLIDGTDDVHPFAKVSTGAHGFYWAPLASALVEKNSRLNADQRRMAIAMLTSVVNSLPAQADEDGVAQARLLVAAAENTPEIAQLARLQTTFVPLVRGSIWAHGFTKPLAQPPTPLAVSECGLTNGLWMALAQELVLSKRKEYPEFLLAKMRILRRKEGFGVASTEQLAFIQNALEGWMQRNAFDRRLQTRLQAEIELTLQSARGQMDNRDLARWDEMLTNHRPETLRDPRYQMRQLYGQDPRRTGVTTFLLVAGSDMRSTYIDFACADPVPRRLRDFRGQWEYDAYLEKFNHDIPTVISFRSWYALHQLTNIPLAAGEKLPDLGISKERWNDLVIAGETAMRTGFKEWREPATVAKLAQVRRDILGEAGAALARPKYSTKPAQAGRALRSFSGLRDDAWNAANREAVTHLFTAAQDITDPETVLAVARIRGPILGDWARLATWLDDPRRRPKDDKDPLHALYVEALIERDIAAGLLTGISFGPKANMESCTQFHDWLKDVLAATGDQRKKLIDDHFPSVIYCPDAASAYPDLRMIGYDIEQGGFASRALLLLSSEEFNPEWLILNGYARIEDENGKEVRIGGPDLEPWLAAVAKLPRTVTPEVLLAELSAAVKVRRDYLAAKPAAPTSSSSEAASRVLTEEEASALILKEEREDNDRRTRWVADGCQDALVRLASRWSPARESAQAELLALGDKVILDDEGETAANPVCIAARVAWEQAKMKGLDNADAFAAATAALPREELKTLATLAQVTTRTQPLLLWHDEHFARAAVAAVASCP
ncbi:MAG: hypothetical protein IPP19_12470 [Verrucomicrobia bacterium]|nr:hypothetical protein [Verrucomicrobiota bacterium]